MKRSDPSLVARKTPRQARSRNTEQVILQAATRVLVERGPERFTTNHVADVAGVSIGSVYQFFPNKAALLARLQQDEARRTLAAIDAALAAPAPPRTRLHAAVEAFFRTELEERPLRRALGASLGPAQVVPEMDAARAAAADRVARMLASDWGIAESEQDFLVDLLVTSVGRIAEDVTDRCTTPDALTPWIEAVTTMLVAVLRSSPGDP